MGLMGVGVLGWVVLSQVGIGRMPKNLGVRKGRLAACPPSSNCLSTQEKGKSRMEPIPYRKSKAEAKSDLLSVIYRMREARVVKDEEDYIHVEIMTPVMRFVDDVEFYLDEGEKTIHFRSASRLGLPIFGVNRKRMEAIRKRFEERQ